MSMTVKQLANSFGLKVGEFASVSGYSKQGLYDIIENGQTNVNKVRFNSFLDHLQLLSNSIHERDIAQARIEKNERDRLIEQLRKEKATEKKQNDKFEFSPCPRCGSRETLGDGFCYVCGTILD